MTRADERQKEQIVDKIRDGLDSMIKGMPLSNQMPQKAKIMLHYPNTMVTMIIKLCEGEEDDV